MVKVRDALGYRFAAVYEEFDEEEIQKTLSEEDLLRRVIGDKEVPGREVISKEALLRQAQELVQALPEVPWDNELLADCLYVDHAEFETLMMESAGGRKRKVDDMGPASSNGRAEG